MNKEEFDKLGDITKDLVIDAMKKKDSEILSKITSLDHILRKWEEVEQALQIEEDLEMLTGKTSRINATHRAAVRNFHRNFSDAWFWVWRV